MSDRSQVISYIQKKFQAFPEYLWARTPNTCVFRHSDNQKWFAIIMDVKRDTMGLSGDGMVDVLNVKCDIDLIGCLLQSPGYRPAYHMSKTNWISIILDGTVSTAEIQGLIAASFKATAGK